MPTIALSRNARNLFARLLASDAATDADDRTLRELERAGLVEPGHSRISEEGLARRREFQPVGDGPGASARRLLATLVAGDRVDVGDETRSDYRELAAWGLMMAGHAFASGDESVYRFTVEGWARRFDFIAPSLSESA